MTNLGNQRIRSVFWLVLAFTLVAVFLLPLLVPVPYAATNSASYLVGFNNRVADAAVVSIGVLVFLFAWRTRGFFAPAVLVEEAAPIPWRLLLGVLVITWLLTAVSGCLVRASHLRYTSDAGYFMEQMATHVETGWALYSQIEFPYGPLLCYPAVWLHALLRCSWMAAYFLTLAMNQTLGVILLAVLLNGLPMRKRERHFGFCLLALGAFSPLLGLNYTLLRFVTPFALLLLATRRSSRWWTAGWFLVGELVLLGISPEQALAFAAATAAYAALRGPRRQGFWIALLFAGQIAEVALFRHSAGPGYLAFLHLASLGTLNLPVGPYPHILIFLFAAVWLVPSKCGAISRDDPRGGQLAAQYALALAMVPAALGRGDPLHIFFNAAGLLVLSLVAISGQSARKRVAWMTAMLVLVGWEQWVNQRVYLYRTLDTMRLAVMPRLSPSTQAAVLSAFRWNPHLQVRLGPFFPNDPNFYTLDVPALERRVGQSPVATPLEVSPLVETALKRSGHYQADSFAFMFDVLDRDAEGQKIATFDAAEWALLPRILELGFLETPGNLGNLQGVRLPYPVRHNVPYYPRAALLQHIGQAWSKVCDLGPYTLYRHQPSPRDIHDRPPVAACM